MPIAFAITAAKWLKNALSAPFGIVARYPWQALCLALCVLLWASWHRGDRYRDKLDAAQKIIAAGEANVMALKAEKARVEANNAAITKRIANEIPPARKAALAAVDTYASRNQCVQPPAVATASGEARASVPSVPDAAPGTAPSGAAAALVAVPKWGADNCTVNTIWAQKWYEWWLQTSAASQQAE